MHKKSLVSCIIPTQNREKILPRSIESVLRQTYKNIEILIIDDCSSDNTETIVSQYASAYPNIHYIRLPQPYGANAARNRGLYAAKGEFIAGLDDDDEWMPNRIELMLGAFEDHYAYVYSDCIEDKNGKQYIERRQPYISYKDMLAEGNITGTQVLTKKAYLVEAGGFDESLPASQDYDMWMRLLQHRPWAKGVNTPLMIRYTRDCDNRISSSRDKAFRAKFRVYKKHKANMSREVRKERLFVIWKIRKKRLTLRSVFRLAPRQQWPKEIRRSLKYKLLKLGNK